jgi:hypothetical protein
MTNENAPTKSGHLSITLTAAAIEKAALEIVSIIEDDLDEKSQELASAAWVDCGLPNIECVEDGPLVAACMELMIDAKNAIVAQVIKLLAQYR